MTSFGEKLLGKTKENLGWATGNKDLEAQGKAEATVAENAAATAATTVSDHASQAVDKAKEVATNITASVQST
ncbi:hypothetical protein BDF19DRAFT_443643 [Syncephalis fuscata]|nr:hypothetical protein BDF19DRAFT_443643 [Syncephalis fuscata]